MLRSHREALTDASNAPVTMATMVPAYFGKALAI